MSTNSDIQYLEEDEIDLRHLFLKLWARRWLVIGSTVSMTAVMAAIAFLMTPTYKAAATLIATSAEKSASGVMEGALSQLGGTNSLASSLAGSLGVSSVDPVTAEALAVLQSRQFTERFINDLNLMPKLYSDMWDADKNKWKVPLNKQPTPAKAYEYFNEKIRSVSMDKKTTLITLEIDWKDRIEAADWANELVRRLNQEMRARAIAKSKASTEYLEKELDQTTFVGAQMAISRLIETQIKLRMLANVTEEYSFRIVDLALPADEDDPEKPKKLLMIVMGSFVGLFLGVLIASVTHKKKL